MFRTVTRHGHPKLNPALPSTATPQVSVVAMSDRKRAFEGTGDSHTSKKLKRFVFLYENLARLFLILAV